MTEKSRATEAAPKRTDEGSRVPIARNASAGSTMRITNQRRNTGCFGSSRPLSGNDNRCFVVGSNFAARDFAAFTVKARGLRVYLMAFIGTPACSTWRPPSFLFDAGGSCPGAPTKRLALSVSPKKAGEAETPPKLIREAKLRDRQFTRRSRDGSEPPQTARFADLAGISELFESVDDGSEKCVFLLLDDRQLVERDHARMRLGVGVLDFAIDPAVALLFGHPIVVAGTVAGIGVSDMELDAIDCAGPLPVGRIGPLRLAKISVCKAPCAIGFMGDHCNWLVRVRVHNSSKVGDVPGFHRSPRSCRGRSSSPAKLSRRRYAMQAGSSVSRSSILEARNEHSCLSGAVSRPPAAPTLDPKAGRRLGLLAALWMQRISETRNLEQSDRDQQPKARGKHERIAKPAEEIEAVVGCAVGGIGHAALLQSKDASALNVLTLGTLPCKKSCTVLRGTFVASLICARDICDALMLALREPTQASSWLISTCVFMRLDVRISARMSSGKYRARFLAPRVIVFL